MTWLPRFHLFGFSTESALTFHPLSIPFQFAFTAQIIVLNTIYATTP